MKMKNIKLLTFIFTMILSVSCEDKLDLVDPNNIGLDIALNSDKNVKTTLIGAYDALSDDDLFGGNTLRNSELLAANDEVVFSGTFNDPSDIFRKQIITSNSDVAQVWINAYRTINIANNIISALDVVNEDDQEQVEGEALFLRGLCYFDLILNFSQPYSAGNTTTNPGVPIMEVEERNSVVIKPRNSVEEVYQQIISDFTTAESYLAEGPNPGKATKEAAAAFLSRVYLQMADYASARDAANRVIASNNYDLTPNISSAFNGGSTVEDLFDIPVSSVDGENAMNTFYASQSNGGRGDIEVQPSHLALYEANDARALLFYLDPATGDTRVGKWTNRFGNVKIIRLAEMYLTRAECNQRLGTTVGATPLADVDYIRDRAGLLTIGTATLDGILNERRIELAHEGQRLHDIKRLKGSISEGANTYQFDDNKLVFPIPQRERDVNGNLMQNAGYGG